ncbi:MAG: hypothetical protein IJ870_02295 [Alphaproteobacteria bacterium]|nr:hypothetical protein [Alphaproteobacteria bacterium]
MAKEEFDKKLLLPYREEDLQKDLNRIKKEWRFIEEDESYMHKTGLKVFVYVDNKNKKAFLDTDPENVEGWLRHMREDFGVPEFLSNQYFERLAKEFNVFLKWYDAELKKQQKNAEVNAEMLPYLMNQSINNPYRS